MPEFHTDFHQKSFRLKHDDDKFLSKLLSKETSKSNPSFRVYYGDVSSSIPFTWETRPGTPKHKSSESLTPPLTPPPSYYTNNLNNPTKKHARSKLLLHNLLTRMNPKITTTHLASPHSSSSLSSMSWPSSSHSSFSTPQHKRRRFSSWGSSFDDRASMDDQVCPSKLSYSAMFVKKALLSVVGRRSAA